MVLVHIHQIPKANAKTSYCIALSPKTENWRYYTFYKLWEHKGEMWSIFLFSSWGKRILGMSVNKTMVMT